MSTLSQCQDFFSAIFDPADVIEFRPIKAASQRWGTPAELPAIVDWLTGLNAKGAQCYFGANPRTKAGESKATGVALARCLYADFDGGVDVEEAWSRIKAAGLPMPTATVLTGGGVHCWWRLDRPVSDAKHHGRLLKALAAALPSDEAGTSGWPRIMRLPGFVNTKYGHKPVAELVDVDAGRVYSLAELQPASRDMGHESRAFIDHGEVPPGGGRRDTMFKVACDLRDRGWTAEAAEAVLMPRMQSFDLSPGELADCPRQIRNAWSREPRAITTPATAPRPATPPIEKWIPFVTDALPKPASTLVEEAAVAIGCDEAFVALPLLAVLGSAIGTTRIVEIKSTWSALPIVWPVTVAESGSQKSPAADVSLDHVRQREDRLNEDHVAELATYEFEVEDYEKSRAAWRHSKAAGQEPPRRPAEPRGRHVMVEDTTVEALIEKLADNPRGLLLAADELASLLGSMGRYNGTPGADEAFFLKTYSGRSHNVSRRTGSRRSTHVRRAAVWITGTIQPGTLRRSIGVERRESGFLARLLLAAPPRRPKKWNTDSINWTTREDFVRVLDALYALEHDSVEGRQQPKVVRLSAPAEELWEAYFTAHDQEARDLTGDLAAAWSKLEETAARLSLIVHEVRRAAGENVIEDRIDSASMAAAIDLVTWFKHETRRVYALLGESEVDRAIRQWDERLLAWIERQDAPVAVRDVVAGCRWVVDADAAEEALARLVAAGCGRWEERRTDPVKGGRPARVFVLVSAQLPKLPALGSCADADACQQAEREAVVANWVDL